AAVEIKLLRGDLLAEILIGRVAAELQFHLALSSLSCPYVVTRRIVLSIIRIDRSHAFGKAWESCQPPPGQLANQGEESRTQTVDRCTVYCYVLSYAKCIET